jgi:hypothetical protein
VPLPLQILWLNASAVGASSARERRCMYTATALVTAGVEIVLLCSVGRVGHTPVLRQCSLWRISYARRADHAQTIDVLKRSKLFDDIEMTWSNDGY